MTTLAQTYLHFKVDASQKTVEAARRYFEYLAAVSASEHFKTEVELDLRVEEGSLKGWLTVMGSIYAGVCAYGSFREGIDYLVKDSQAFSEYIIRRTIAEAHPAPDAIVRTERRLGVPGQIQRLNQVVEEASNALLGADHESSLHLLEKVRAQLDRIERELVAAGEVDAQRQLVDSLPTPVLHRLPNPRPPQHGQAGVVQSTLLATERPLQLAIPRQRRRQFGKPPPPPVLN